jgi:hypothetical protein
MKPKQCMLLIAKIAIFKEWGSPTQHKFYSYLHYLFAYIFKVTNINEIKMGA